MPPDSVTVRAPATSANLGPGFDCLGLALDLWATVTVARPATAGRRRAGQPQPQDPASRMALGAVGRLYRHLGERPPPVAVAYQAAFPAARGLGASAAVRGAALVAANALLGGPLDREELLGLGAELEGHADNMAACLFGGLQVVVEEEEGWPPAMPMSPRHGESPEATAGGHARIEGGKRWRHLGLAPPAELRAVLFIPHLAMPTDQSRRLLPRSIPRRDAVHNIGRAALLIGALASGRLELLATATRDRLHQPARARLFPALDAILDAALAAGALGAYLSGGGSTLLALAQGGEEAIAGAMAAAAAERGVTGEALVTRPTQRGAYILP